MSHQGTHTGPLQFYPQTLKGWEGPSTSVFLGPRTTSGLVTHLDVHHQNCSGGRRVICQGPHLSLRFVTRNAPDLRGSISCLSDYFFRTDPSPSQPSALTNWQSSCYRLLFLYHFTKNFLTILSQNLNIILFMIQTITTSQGEMLSIQLLIWVCWIVSCLSCNNIEE